MAADGDVSMMGVILARLEDLKRLWKGCVEPRFESGCAEGVWMDLLDYFFCLLLTFLHLVSCFCCL